MIDIRCPNCGHSFPMDASDYDLVARTVRDREFSLEVERQAAIIKNEFEARRELLEAQMETRASESARKQRDSYEAKIRDLEDTVRDLRHQNDSIEEATRLKGQLEVQALEAKLAMARNESELAASDMRESYEQRLRDKDEQIAYYRDLKARQSTKMVGETLERHCEAEFNKLRSLGFQGVYFEKDNDARTGSKGDYIYRETDESGVEVLSIMFEMKNQMDDTDERSKHRNEDFFKELDKDRNEKKCEFAVLVSLLETDSELYNQGIVDVSHRYPKMYVIRPQFFIPMITLLRNAARGALSYKKELAMERARNLDVESFEEKLSDFKSKFMKNHDMSQKKFGEAVDEIDKAISRLEKARAALVSCENNFRLAGEKLDDLTIRKLTRGNEGMTDAFAKAGLI